MTVSNLILHYIILWYLWGPFLKNWKVDFPLPPFAKQNLGIFFPIFFFFQFGNIFSTAYDHFVEFLVGIKEKPSPRRLNWQQNIIIIHICFGTKTSTNYNK